MSLQSPRPCLEDLPTELLNSILILLDPKDAIAIALTCRRLRDLSSDNLVWRHYYRTGWQYWEEESDNASLTARSTTTDWKAQYLRRRHKDRFISYTVDEMLTTQQARNLKIMAIVDSGYDAMDELLRQHACRDDYEDVLARRYFVEATISTIHKSKAIKMWKRVRDGEDVPVEDALAGFDLFVIGNIPGDLGAVKRDLDSLAAKFKQQQPDLDRMTPRDRTLTLVSFMRSQGFVGTNQEKYTDMHNNFVGLALRHPSHGALPLVNAVIFSAVAQRIGINAHPNGFPFHINIIVQPPEGHDMDGRPISTLTAPTLEATDRMFVDPWTHADEVPELDLHAQLLRNGLPENLHEPYLHAATARDLILRSSRNIVRSVSVRAEFDPPSPSNTFTPDIHDAFYGAAWANILLSIGADGPIHDLSGRGTDARSARRQLASLFTQRFQPDFPWDVGLMKEFMLPQYIDTPEYAFLESWLEDEEAKDEKPRVPIRRDLPAVEVVQYRVGQLFQHKRYGYEAVVIGWDKKCSAGEQWIVQNGVDTLTQGREQSFYHVLVVDKSLRYVAQENIHPVFSAPSPQIEKLAGRYFKRWDDMGRKFVSNVRDDYPDD